MSKSADNASGPDSQPSERRGLRSSVQVFGSHREVRAHEIARQARLSPYERMQQFMELQERIWGTDNPDIRDSGAIHIERRNHGV